MCQFFCGMEGGFSPCHYDPQDNLFGQVRGYKRVLLFHPKHFGSLYPWPLHHPQDRQSRVDFDAPDVKAYPRYEELTGKGLEAIVGPGDILHIPPAWWHHIEMLPSPSGEVVSINFWYNAPSWFKGNPQQGDLTWESPLSGMKLTFFRRAVEELVGKLAAPTDVPEILSSCAKGKRHFPAPGSRLFEVTNSIHSFVATVITDANQLCAFFAELLEGRFEGLQPCTSPQAT